VPTLRQELKALREEARGLTPAALPSRETVTGLWTQLQAEAARQQRSVFETSSMLAISAVKTLPDNARWLSASALVGASKTGHIVASALLDHYRATLNDIRETGFATYAARHLAPYVRAAVGHFSPERVTLTERFLERKTTKGHSS
jgi:hypothetical protein